MILYRLFEATRDDVLELVREQRLLRLVTVDAAGVPAIGLHVFWNDGLTFEAHLVASDPQLVDLTSGRPVVIEIDDTLSSIPHHWVDPDDVSHADQFYRSASIHGEAEVIDEPAALAEHLTRIVTRYQPEHPVPVDETHPPHAGQIARLRLVRFAGRTFTSKFKLGQGMKEDALRSVIAALNRRGTSLDTRTAAHAERFLSRR